MSAPNRGIRATLKSEPGVLKVHKVRPLRRTCVAARITERSICRIADIIGEDVYKTLDGDSRMTVGNNSVPTGWWVVWHGDSPRDFNLYSDSEFNNMYEGQDVAADAPWPTEPLIILLDASYEGTRIDCPAVAMRTSVGNYMLPGGTILGENIAVIRDYEPATAMRLDYARTLLAGETAKPAPRGHLAAEAWDLINENGIQ